MRDELKEVIKLKSNPNKIYGLDQDSIRHFLDATKAILATRRKEREAYMKKHLIDGLLDIDVESYSDHLYYHNLDDQYIYQFVFIKSLGIIEYKVDEKLSTKDIHKPLVEKIALLDPSINTIELGEWVRLRNELAHRPFEPYSPVTINWEDIEEFSGVVLETMQKLKFR